MKSAQGKDMGRVQQVPVGGCRSPSPVQSQVALPRPAVMCDSAQTVATQGITADSRYPGRLVGPSHVDLIVVDTHVDGPSPAALEVELTVTHSPR